MARLLGIPGILGQRGVYGSPTLNLCKVQCMDDNCGEWVEATGVVSRRWMWVEFMGVVVRRYID